MGRYFFHIRDGDELIQDDEGQELPSLETVRLEAIEGAQEILSEAVLTGRAARLRLQIEVVDEAGQTVLTMPVGRATDTESQT